MESRLERIRANWWQLMRYTKNLTFLTDGYDQLAGIFPVLVAAPATSRAQSAWAS